MAVKRRKTRRRRKRGTPRPKQRSTAKGVKRLKSSSFAYPKTRKYPINTRKRARAALAMAGTASSLAGSGARSSRLLFVKCCISFMSSKGSR